MATSGSSIELIPKLIEDLQECIQALCTEFKATGLPINDDNVTLHCFWARFEFLLEHELKEKYGLLGSRKSYWDYFCKCLASKRFIHDGLKYVKSVTEFKTSLGRGRAFIRFCLMNKSLADTLQQCLQDDSKTREFFCERSLFFQTQYRSTLISALYDLNEIQFDLSPVGHDLDVGWPTFAKKIPGSPYQWNAPSRTMSLSSLISQTELAREAGESASHLDQDKVLYNLDESTNEPIEVDDSNKQESDSILCDPAKLMGKTDASWWSDQEAELSQQLEHMEVTEKEYLRVMENATQQQENRQSGVSLDKEWVDKIGALESEKSSLMTNVEELKNRLLVKEEAEAALTEELGKLKKEDAAGKAKTLKELEWLRVEVKRLSDDNVRLDEDNTQVTEQIGKWKKCFNACTEKLSIKNKINEHLEKQVSALKEAVAAMKEMVAVKTTETSKLRELVSELKARNEPSAGESSGNKLAAVEAENVALKSTVTDLTNNVENLKRLLDDQAETLRKKDDAFAEMAQTIVLKDETIKELGIRVTHTQDHLGQLSAENENLKSNLERLGGVAKEIEKAEEELEKLETNERTAAESQNQGESHGNEDDDNASSNVTTVNYMLYNTPNLVPEHFPELCIFNKTLKRLRCLITEKQDLQLKLKSSNDLNSSLISKVKEQANKLSSVTFELSQTKACIEHLRSAHSKLQTSEAILHYELKEKRSVVDQMKRLLESSRSQWLRIRQKQSESELEWQNLRADFASRVKQESLESGYTEDSPRTEPLSPVSLQSPSTSSADIPALASETNDLDPPPLQSSSPATASEIGDLSVSQGDDDEYSSDVPGPAPTSRVRMRLQMMEDQCRQLYNRLVVSLKKSEFLEWKLSHLHEEHGGEPIASDETAGREEIPNENLSQINTKFDIIFVPFTEDNLKKSSRDVITPENPDMEYCLNESEELQYDNSEGVIADVLELDDTNEVVENDDNGNAIEGEIEMDKPPPLTLAQALPKRVELLRKSKEDLEKNLKQMMEQKLESEAREAIRISELDLLRSTIDDLEMTIQRIESEKMEILQREAEFKKRAGYIMKKDREERETRYQTLLKVKEELQERMDRLYLQLEDEVSRYKQMEDNYFKCLGDLESNKQEKLSLRYQLSTEAIKHEQVTKRYEEHESSINDMKDRIAEQEQLISCLEQQLESIKQDRTLENEQQMSIMKAKDMCLTTREEECAALSEDLKTTSRLLDVSNNENQRITCALEEMTVERNTLLKENKVLQNDSVDLRQNIVQLIKDKDKLWKRSEQLSSIQKMQASDRWLKDDEVRNCLDCKAEFTLLLRKHHCRQCGRIFCSKCSDNWTETATHRRRVRMCNECVTCHAHLVTDSTMVDNEEGLPSPSSTSSLNAVETLETRINVQEDLEVEENNECVATVSSGSVPIENAASRNDVSLLGRLFSSWSHSPKSKCVLDDDEFIVITDEEISQSLSHSSPYAPVHRDSSDESAYVCPTRNIEDLIGESGTTHTREIWVNAGKTFSIPITILNKTILTWEFTSEPKSIVFSMDFRREDEVDDPMYPSQCLIPSTYCGGHLSTKRGRLIARRPGVYTFCFDNASSKFIAKKVRLTITVHKDEVSDGQSSQQQPPNKDEIASSEAASESQNPNEGCNE